MENDAVRFQISPDPKWDGGRDGRRPRRSRARRRGEYRARRTSRTSSRIAVCDARRRCDGSRALVLALEAFFEILGPRTRTIIRRPTLTDRRAEAPAVSLAAGSARRAGAMGVDPWADENDEHETRAGVSSGEGVDELEREARRRREQVRATANPHARPARPVKQCAFSPQWAPPPLTIPPPLPRPLAVLQRGVPRGRRGREESHRAGGV